MKIQNIQNNTPKYYSPKAQHIGTYPSFNANPSKSIKEFSYLEKLKFKLSNHLRIKNFVEESKKTIQQISQKYISDMGFECPNRIKIPKEIIAGGFYEPFTNCIYINKNMIRNCGILKCLGSEDNFDDIAQKILFFIPIHETQHKIQAIQIYRLPEKKEHITKLLKQNIEELKVLNDELLINNIHKEKIIEIKKELKTTTDKTKKTELKKELKKQKLLSKCLSKYLKGKNKEIKNFNINEIFAEFDTILKQKGEIIKGSEEEALALKYLEAHEKYPILVKRFLPSSNFPSKEAHKQHLEKLSADYFNNFLEINANENAAKYIEENKDVIEALYSRFRHI